MGYYNNLYIALKTEVTQRINRREELQILSEFIRDLSGTVIEIGCNVGYLTGRIVSVKNVTHAVGIDTNKSKAVEMFAKIRNLGKGVKFFYGVSGTKTPFSERSVDGIVMSHVLEHFENPSEILAELHRVLKIDGQAIIAVPKEKFLGEFTPDHKILFESLVDLERILDINGFKVVEAREIAKAIIVKCKEKN